MHKFKLGRLVATREIASRMDSDVAFADFVNSSLKRYVLCDWGKLDKADKEMNDEAVKNGDSRILAVYVYNKTDEKIWIITEWDRSVTTILYPHEY